MKTGGTLVSPSEVIARVSDIVVSPGDIVVGVFVAALGMVGLVMAAGALDQEIYIFGLSLFAFTAAFNWGQVLKGFRRGEALQAELLRARGGRDG